MVSRVHTFILSPLLAGFALMLSCGSAQGAPSGEWLPGAEPRTVHTQVMFKVGDEVDFEITRVPGGAEVVLFIDRPVADVTAPYLAEDDPLVGEIRLAATTSGSATLAHIFLRERNLRSAVQTLENPFRIVLDLLYDDPGQRPAPVVKAVVEAEPPSVFSLGVPLDQDLTPPMMEPEVTGAVDGIGRDLYRRAAWALEQGRVDEAQRIFTTFTEKFKDSPLADPADYYLAEIRYHRAWSGNLEARAAAARHYDRLGQRYRRSPNVALGFIRMAEVLLAEGKAEEARDLVDVVIGEYPDSRFLRLAHRVRADVALEQNHLRTAIKHYTVVRRGFKDDSDGLRAAIGLAETLGRMGRFPEAVRYYERGLAAGAGRIKGDPQALRRMGRALTEAGRFRDARYVFLTLFNLYPHRYPPGLALSQVADTFRGEARWEEAERRYQEVIEGYPKGEGSLAARIALADLYVERHRETKPETVRPLVETPMATSDHEQLLAEALRLYSEVIEVAPSDPLAQEALYKTGLLFEVMGDDRELLARSADLVTRYPETHWRGPAIELAERGLARQAGEYVAAGEAARAVALYRQYQPVLFQPRIVGWKPHYSLGLASEALGLNRDARRHYLELLGSRAPDAYRSRVIYRLGNLYLSGGEPDEAIKRFDYYQRRYPQGELIGLVLLRAAEAHERLEKDGTAARLYERYLARHADGDDLRRARLAAARVYERLYDIPRARGLYRAVLKSDRGAGPKAEFSPATAMVNLRLADLEYGQKRFTSAVTHYRAAVAKGLEADDRRWAELRGGTASLALSRNGDAGQTLQALAEELTGSVIPKVAREIGAGIN